MTSSKRSSGGFFIKEFGEHTFSHDGAKWRIHQHYFRLPVAFCMTVRIFRMVMRNCFSLFPLVCYSQHPFYFILHDYVKISHGHEKSKNMLFRLLFAISLIFSFLIHLHHLQFSSKAWLKPITLLLSLCIWIIINFICFLQFDSSLLSPIYQNHTLKCLQNFIKLVSISCKGKNMLIECFRHNYYSKDVKLMRIII